MSEAVKYIQRKRLKLKEAYLFLMSTEHGRRVFAQQLETYGLWRMSFVPNAPHETTEFRDGQRHSALILYNDLNEFCPELLITLLQEKQREDFELRELRKQDEVDRGGGRDSGWDTSTPPE